MICVSQKMKGSLMKERQSKIILKSVTDYKHEIVLCFKSQTSLYDNFLIPIEDAKNSDKCRIVTLEIEQGVVGSYRHFNNDYNIDNRFDIVVENIATIQNATLLFDVDYENDQSGDMWMKNIKISFNSGQCKSIKE